MRRSLALAGLAAALAAACDGGGPPPRGFQSRQVYASSDPMLGLAGWSEKGLHFGMGDAYFDLDLATGEITPDPGLSRPNGTYGERYSCLDGTDLAGTRTVTVVDAQTGQSTRIEGVKSWSTCPMAPDQVVTAWRSSVALDDVELWVGPYDQLKLVTLPLVVRQVVSDFSSGSAALVLAAPKAEPEAVGLYSLAPGTFDATAVLPAKLGSAAMAAGAVAVGDLSSSRLSTKVGVQRYVDSHADSYADYYFYARVMSDGREAYFIGPFTEGPSELAIAPVPATRQFIASQAGGLMACWVEPGADADVIRAWSLRRRRLVSCPWPHTWVVFGSSTADGRRLLIGGGDGMSYTEPTALMLVSFDGAETGMGCTPLASSGVESASFSREDGNIHWIAAASPREWGLWVADGDGTNARMVFTSPSMKGGHFLDDHRLELTLGGDLVWLDADRPEDGLHFVAENAFGYPIDLGGNTALTGYDYNPPDDTGKLGLVDRSTGAKRLVSAAVSQYSIRIDGLDDGAVWPLAYLVRGRHPSAQDGIWVASIPVGDLR